MPIIAHHAVHRPIPPNLAFSNHSADAASFVKNFITRHKVRNCFPAIRRWYWRVKRKRLAVPGRHEDHKPLDFSALNGFQLFRYQPVMLSRGVLRERVLREVN
jgi:hypothetical protein